MRLLKSLIFLLISFILCSCGIFLNKNSDDYASQFISNTPKKCGDAHFDENSSKVENCIFSSLANTQPFYAWYWLPPVDSEAASGILFNSKKELYIGWYDDFNSTIWGNTFKTTKCNSWYIQTYSQKNKLICKLPKSTKVYLFNLESFLQIENE